MAVSVESVKKGGIGLLRLAGEGVCAIADTPKGWVSETAFGGIRGRKSPLAQLMGIRCGKFVAQILLKGLK